MMAWQRLPISAILRKSEDWVQPEPDRIYQQIRVRLWGKGLTLRGKVAGANISASRQLRASTGQFLVSRIDARHGAFGIVPDHLDGALVSSDFPCFDINERVVLPSYLGWYSRTDQFVELCRRASEGSTNRVRLKEDRFMVTELDLPPIGQQRRICDRIDTVHGMADAWKREAEVVGRDAQTMLSNVFRRIIKGAPRLPLEEVAPLVRRSVDVQPDGNYPELGVRSFGRGTFHKFALDGATVGTKRLYYIRDGDLLFNIVFAWEGAVAVAQPEDAGRVGSHRFLTCVPDGNIVTSCFLHFYFLTSEGLDQLGAASPGGAGRNRTLGLNKLNAIRVPLPNIERQRWFDRVRRLALNIEELRTAAVGEMNALHSGILHTAFA